MCDHQWEKTWWNGWGCIPCQKNKMHRYTRSALQNLDMPDTRFNHLHVHTVGPLPLSQGNRYRLAIIDRFSRWPEAIPMLVITTEAVAKALYTGWISCFEVPNTTTTDQRRQFEASQFRELLKFLGTKRCRIAAYHPQSNGLVEHWHRQLKSSIIAHESTNWIDFLPTVLLQHRTAIKGD